MTRSPACCCLPAGGKLLGLDNGAYGRRIAEIAGRLGIAHTTLDSRTTGRERGLPRSLGRSGVLFP